MESSPCRILFKLVLLVYIASATPARADLDIGGILRIESPITLVDTGTQEVGAAAGMTVFIGEGDAILPDSSINPLARGLLITDAVVGVVKVGSDYAVVATGSGSIIGASGVVLSGPIQARVNMLQTAVSKIISVEGSVPPDFINLDFDPSEVASPSGDPFQEILGNSVGIGVIGQTIFGDLSVRKLSLNRNSTIEGALNFGIFNAITNLGNEVTDIVTLSDVSGDLLIMSDGTAGVLAGLFSSPALSSAGDFFLQVNTTSQQVNQDYEIDGELRTVVAEAGPSVSVISQGAFLNIAGQNLAGDFKFQQDPSGNVVGQASSVISILGDGITELLTLFDGSGIMLLTPDGTGVDIEGPVAFADSGISASSNFHLLINSTGSEIDQTINIGGISQQLSLSAGIVLMQASNAQLAVLDSQLVGDFQFLQIISGQLQGLLANGALLLNDGTGTALTVASGSGLVFMNSSGTGMQFVGDVSINDPEVSTSESFLVSVNTGTSSINETLSISGELILLDLPAGPYLRVEGIDSSLVISGQTLTGNFLFEQQTGAPVLVIVTNGSYAQGGSVISLSNAEGPLLLFSNGIAGELSGLTSLSVPGMTVGSNFIFQVNTTGQAVDEIVDLGFSTIAISLPAGPFIRLIGVDALVSIAGLDLAGNFIFEQVSELLVNLSASSVSFSMGGGVLTASDCIGLLEIDSTGAAGALALPFTILNAPSISLSGTAELALFNTRPTAVNGDFDLGGTIVSLFLPSGSYSRIPYPGAIVSLNRLIVGGLPATIVGDLFFEPFGGLARLRIENGNSSTSSPSLSLDTGGGDILLTEGGLQVVLPEPIIDYGISLNESVTVTGGDFATSSPVSLRIHPGALQTGDITLIDFSLATSSVNAADFGVSPALPSGFNLTVSGGELLLSSAVKPDADDDGLSDAWESTYGPDDTSLSPTDNSDGDDLDALAEFALGLNPTISDSPELIPSFTMLGGQEYLSLTYPRNVDAIGLVGIFTERSTDLGNTDPWSIDDTVFESSTSSEVTDRSIFPLVSDSKEFLRLRFLKP
ncbi:hypothetical protein G0Q06_10260 [Puniceicoccales bacterium CK1056]|uniref:Uncharacterized protein n=1 Tax=Oceanipulchritudo coccoides TaxID=2706888 RepID=A0A6B2M276_9BACT|nr:hypothetical protein [Oceanipulchritudo coccoides]NDV62833.1 hypothetical protein [Oceanipulchritudo coccoides]